MATTTTRPPDRCWTCADILTAWGQTEDGVYDIWLKDPTTGAVTNTSAYCDMTGGGYTVIQRLPRSKREL